MSVERQRKEAPAPKRRSCFRERALNNDLSGEGSGVVEGVAGVEGVLVVAIAGS
jgi:hypothetical protein